MVWVLDDGIEVGVRSKSLMGASFEAGWLAGVLFGHRLPHTMRFQLAISLCAVGGTLHAGVPMIL
jgi:hypothetical protein